MSGMINQVRFLNYISGVLYQQQTDPLCRNCKAFVNTAVRMREGLAELSDLVAEDAAAVTPEILSLIAEARRRLDCIRTPEDAEGQKKAGRCKMPEGVCFIKSSKAIRDRI